MVNGTIINATTRKTKCLMNCQIEILKSPKISHNCTHVNIPTHANVNNPEIFNEMFNPKAIPVTNKLKYQHPVNGIRVVNAL